MLRTTRALLIALSIAFSGCSGGERGTGGSTNTYTVGEPLQPGVCTEDIDCPLQYVCQNGICRAIDNDFDNDGYDASVDCDDNNKFVHPGAEEICNGIDDNCNNQIDEGVLNACGECGPVPEEICDLIDNDCDGIVDNDCKYLPLPEIEPNNGSAHCQWIPLPQEVGGAITVEGTWDPAGDIDSFCFETPPGSSFTFDIDSQVLGAPTDGVLALFDGNTGVALPGGYNDFQPGVGPDPFLAYDFDLGGPVRVNIYNFDQAVGHPSYVWKLTITATRITACTDQDGDGVETCAGDCDDTDISIFPGQTEICDGKDNNCDGQIDEGCPSLIVPEREPNDTTSQCELLTVPFSRGGAIATKSDVDYYCFFVAGGTRLGFDIDAQEMNSLLDSRIEVMAVSGPALPASPIKYNDDGRDPETGYEANRSDSYLAYTFQRPGIYALKVDGYLSSIYYGPDYFYTLHVNVLASPECTDEDGDGVTTCEGDCNDSDPTVHFGHPEICDGKDNDCNGVGDPVECGEDADGDGFTAADGDCDDNDISIHPNAIEVCDGVDNNCDGQVDEGTLNACGTCGFPPPEICGDGIDNDCDGEIDTDCDQDLDGDGFTPNDGDCLDADPLLVPMAPFISPAAEEICDGLDNNCDGRIDELVKNACGYCGPAPEEICDGIDNDCNGLVDDGALNACGECGPTPEEVCDGVDNNCNGQIDEGLLNDCGECGPLPAEVCDWIDNNCNGLIDEGCDVHGDGDGQTRRQGDCNDNDDTVYWGAPELCDGVDNDCNGYIDDHPDCIPDEVEPNNTHATCNPFTWPGQQNGVIATAGDNDFFCLNITVPETRLGIDVDARDLGSPLDPLLEIRAPDGTMIAQNNSGRDPEFGQLTVDPYLEFVFDEPGTYTASIRGVTGTGAGAFYELHIKALGGCLDLDGDGITTCDGDCNDFNSSINPGAIDICDGLDNNCDGQIDERCVGTCLDDIYEDNDTLFTATEVALNGPSLSLTFCGGDVDFFALDVGAGDHLRIDLNFLHEDGDLDMELIAPDGLTLVGSSLSNDDNEEIEYLVPSAGRYFLRVFGPLGINTPYALRVQTL